MDPAAVPIPPDEVARLQRLQSYRLLDTPAESVFDEFTEVASHICGTPISLISLVDEHRQWFKSVHGLDTRETPRSQSFCAHALNRADDMLVVEDALDDPRFQTNPLVTHEPRIRFYAGAPLVTPDGYTLGTLCVIDRVPRKIGAEATEALRALARILIAMMELRRQLDESEESPTA